VDAPHEITASTGGKTAAPRPASLISRNRTHETPFPLSRACQKKTCAEAESSRSILSPAFPAVLIHLTTSGKGGCVVLYFLFDDDLDHDTGNCLSNDNSEHDGHSHRSFARRSRPAPAMAVGVVVVDVSEGGSARGSHLTSSQSHRFTSTFDFASI
jgi:hypothetical protein